ncbi:MAG TPA: DUF998 domain-containing protein [Ktedonobacterales bacterium]|nr:DUF998 domain-containing protein [Ktedonobacterales bacterium]
MRHNQSFVARYPLAGPILWISSIQFFLVQIVVVSAWKRPYSWRLNAISDLGAISCGPFDDRYVCSPFHGLMNISFILLGLTMAVGSVLMYQAVHKSRVGFSLMALAGVGAIVVGLFPEDTTYWAHIVGQDLAFILGNIALIVFGFTLHLQRWFNWYSILSGVVALVALYLFLSHNRFFLGLGGMERVVAYPLILWLIVTGLYVFMNRSTFTAKHVKT